MDAHLKRGKLEFLVLWKGYGDEDRMWEPETHLDNSRNTLPQSLEAWTQLFNSLFQPMPKNLTTTSGIWSRLEVEP
ncbi:hypothetical protein SERLA73DRAFT_80002 [Serpula lacrymans var. lacrymans S7.3]|uniref:Chromo domain-containing protein n=1 Tax=Serpula lacrymans var. lacrymans (strain S7.3) TaxID=936435 RepID=F8QIB8_SERL3|nr:hypothetical protein SERLA73DRAFT_80002 [Serpula lacrymans var. lacrymans S7.3]